MSKHTPDSGRVPSLEEIELEVEAEGREWTRRLQERLQQLADTHGTIFPSGRPAAAPARAARWRRPFATAVIRGTGAGAVRSWKPGA